MQQIKIKPTTQSFILDELPPTMNEIITMAKPFRNNKKCSPYALAKIHWNQRIRTIVRAEKLKPFTTSAWVHLRFFVNKKIDLDNLRACQKFILDGMVKCKFIPSDSRKWVKNITYEENEPLSGVVAIVTVSDKPMYKQVHTKIKTTTQSFILDTLPPTMNEIIAMAKPFKKSKKCSNYNLTKIKWNKNIGDIVRAKKLKPFTTPVWVHIRFFVNLKIDLDNLRACQKFIIDGMVKSKFITSDGRKKVKNITYEENEPLDGVVLIVTVSDQPMYKQVLIKY
jgi:hypothetical protein